MDNLVQFNGFLFNSEIGELVHRDESGNETISRLQPQPAKLLRLLLENHPNVVTREQIKEAIWPDVHVDFDGSMHFCIRQIRAALDDHAADPKYIETIPRRGYRWIAEIKRNGETATNGIDQIPPTNKEVGNDISNGIFSPTNKSRNKKIWFLSLLGIAIAPFLFYLFFLKTDAINALPNTPEKIRIAIMPFQSDDESNPFAGNDIAYQLVETLTNQYQGQFEIIGPTTTSTIDPQEIFEFATDYRIDYLINGRFLKNENEYRLLAELIRSGDGAHVWVQSFDAVEVSDSIFLEIENGVVGYLNIAMDDN